MTRRFSRFVALTVLPVLRAVLLTVPAYAIDPGDTSGGDDDGGGIRNTDSQMSPVTPRFHFAQVPWSGLGCRQK